MLTSVDNAMFFGRSISNHNFALLLHCQSPVSRELIHLCMFPEPELDPFDFDIEEKSSVARAPVAYPILCGHVLAHTTAALIAVTGRARAEEGRHSIDSVVDDCRHFVLIGLVARVAQVLLARLKPNLSEVCSIIEQKMMQHSGIIDNNEQEWRHFCTMILRTMLSQKTVEPRPVSSFNSHPPPKDADIISSHMLHAIEFAKTEAVTFLRDLSLVSQILIPNIFKLNSANEEDAQCEDLTVKLKKYMALLCVENHCAMIQSGLLQQMLKSWYAQSTGKISNQLYFPRTFQGATWPVPPRDDQHGMARPEEIPTTCLPLLGNCRFTTENGSKSRIFYLPKSYTDLYAELSEMRPDSEQTALCLVCGQVSQYLRSHRLLSTHFYYYYLFHSFHCRRY